MSELTLRDFKVSLKDTLIAEIKEFSFQNGSIYTIFGRSGIGKSTLLKAMGSLIPYDGKMLLNGKDSKDYSIDAIRKAVHYVRQDPKFLPGTAMDNINYIFKLKNNEHIVFDKDLFHKLLKRLNLKEELLEKDVKNLSGGEKQRLSLIRSLLIKPVFLLLDEPTSALDIHTEGQLIDFLQEIKNDVGVIIVSHSPNLIKHSDKKLLFSEKTLNYIDYEITEKEISALIGEHNE